MAEKTFVGNCEELCLTICNNYTKQEIKDKDTQEITEIVYSCHYWACKKKEEERKK